MHREHTLKNTDPVILFKGQSEGPKVQKELEDILHRGHMDRRGSNEHGIIKSYMINSKGEIIKVLMKGKKNTWNKDRFRRRKR